MELPETEWGVPAQYAWEEGNLSARVTAHSDKPGVLHSPASRAVRFYAPRVVRVSIIRGEEADHILIDPLEKARVIQNMRDIGITLVTTEREYYQFTNLPRLNAEGRYDIPFSGLNLETPLAGAFVLISIGEPSIVRGNGAILMKLLPLKIPLLTVPAV